MGKNKNEKKARCFVSKAPGIILATTYSRTTYRSTTIGSAAFHFRVRDGNGWVHCAGSPDFAELVFKKKLRDRRLSGGQNMSENRALFFENRTLGENYTLR